MFRSTAPFCERLAMCSNENRTFLVILVITQVITRLLLSIVYNFLYSYRR